MIPILKSRTYSSDVINFKTIGFLKDAYEAIVTEERNGIFEFSFNYPVDGSLFDELKEDLIVEAKPNDTDNIQKFRIYEITKPISGVVTVNCEHISYELKNYPVKNVSLQSMTPHGIIGALLDNAKQSVSGENSNINLYTARSSGRTTTGSINIPIGSLRSALGGTEGSVLDVFGGELKFDNFEIYFPTERGSDKGVIVAYRKNLIDVKLTSSMESSYTHLFPYAVKDDKYYFLDSSQYPTGTIAVTNNSGISERVLIRDFSSDFGEGETITPQLLSQKANSYLSSNNINELAVSMSVSFVNLWQSPEYQNYAPLEKVGLCDIVTVHHEKLKIDLKLKVIKTSYDVISERYTKIELGSAKSNFADTISQQQKQINNALKIARETGYSRITAEYQQAINDATRKITGNSGGNVVFTMNAFGYPEEITIMDTGDTSTATNCWRWNLSGLGYSASGYSGPYNTAITADGKIVADFITTGTMTAERIRAGRLSSEDGRTYFDLTNSKICTVGSIGTNNFQTIFNGGSIEFYGQTSGGQMGKTAKIRTGYKTANETTTKHFAIGYISNDISEGVDGAGSLKLGAFQASNDQFIDILELSGLDGAVFGTSSQGVNAKTANGHFESNTLKTDGETVTTAGNFSTGLKHYSASMIEGKGAWRQHYFGSYVDSNKEHWTGWTSRNTDNDLLHSFCAKSEKYDDYVYFRIDNGKGYTSYIGVNPTDKKVAFRSNYGNNFSYDEALDLYCKCVYAENLHYRNSNDEIVSVTSRLSDLYNTKTSTSVTGTEQIGSETHYDTLDRHNGHLGVYYKMLRDSVGWLKVGFHQSAGDEDHDCTYLHIGQKNNSDTDIAAYHGTIAVSSASNFAFYKGNGKGSIHTNIYVANVYTTSTEESKKNISSSTINAISLLETSRVYNYDYKTEEDYVENVVRAGNVQDNSSSESGETSEEIPVATETGSNLNFAMDRETPGEATETGSNLGFVIGRETPKEVISETGDAVNLYSFTSLTWLALQQLLERLKTLENRVTELESESTTT